MPAPFEHGRSSAGGASPILSMTGGLKLRGRRPPLSLYLIVGGVLVFVVYYLVTYVPASGNGSDFQAFYSAAIADKQGVNPFDWPSLWRVQQVVFNGGLGRGLPFAFSPFGNPPPYALILRPFTDIPESQAYRIWAVFLGCCCGIGAYLSLYDWQRRPRLVASALVAGCPASLLDLRLGQDSTPLLLALGAAYQLMDRGKPFWGGLCLGCGLYKPHLMGPIAVMAILFAPQGDRKGLAAGIAVSGALAVLVGVLFDGGFAAYGHWISGVRQFGDTLRQQPDLASVAGFYQGSGLEGILNTLCVLMAAGIICVIAARAQGAAGRDRRNVMGGGIAVYFALSPYVHTSDQILLAPGLLALIGPEGEGLRDRAVLLAAWIVVLAPMVVIRDYHTTGINALPPIAVALAYWMQGRPAMRATRIVHG